MAKPIAPTPALSGQAAIDFFTTMEKANKLSDAEKASIKIGAERIKAMLTFEF